MYNFIVIEFDQRAVEDGRCDLKAPIHLKKTKKQKKKHIKNDKDIEKCSNQLFNLIYSLASDVLSALKKIGDLFGCHN